MIDEDLKTIVVGLLLVVAGFTVFQAFFADRVVEPFSELVVGEEFDLYLYMGNHMGSPQMYRVYVKLGDRGLNVSDTSAYPAPVVTSYQYSLGDKQNVTLPITLSISEAGVNSRLVFEMHRFDVEAGEFVYHERWNQLWLNVTGTG